ncbi:hypothetical protein [Sulfodiicoccus acidiphilus]|nr:hypothetical protein [Sulfodiicoccus acidiphilus]
MYNSYYIVEILDNEIRAVLEAGANSVEFNVLLILQFVIYSSG